MCSKRIVALVAAVVLSWVLAAAADWLPGQPQLQPLLSLDELLSRLDGEPSFELTEALGQAARLGPEYTWLLADLAQREDLEMFSYAPFSALARNGDTESLSVLRAIAADTARSDFARGRAAKALADARDRDAIPLLEEIAAGSSGEWLAKDMHRAIRRIESPGHYRPLFSLVEGLVSFGFLLDDIESVEYTEIIPELRHSFDPSEFREICDLLQRGSPVTVVSTRDTGKLAFVLKSGRQASLSTDGRAFIGVNGGDIDCPSLGAYIWSQLGRSYDLGEPPN